MTKSHNENLNIKHSSSFLKGFQLPKNCLKPERVLLKAHERELRASYH